LVELGSLQGDEDAIGILELVPHVERYLLGFHWCTKIVRLRFACGFAKCAVFFAEIEPTPGADHAMWVITGDVPPLYIDTSCRNGKEAIDLYIELYSYWIESVRKDESVDDLPEVRTAETFDILEPSLELADMLESRLNFLRKNLWVFE
jgi:hypothetical protein